MSELVGIAALVIGVEVVVVAKFADLIEDCEVARAQSIQGVSPFQSDDHY